MNFKKLLIAVVAVVVLIAGFEFFTGVDRTNPLSVATAFTKAYKAGNIDKASKYWLPDQADSWRTTTDDTLDHLHTNGTEMFYEHIPSAPNFTEPMTSPAGVTTVQSADKTFSLEMTKVGTKWYVSKAL